MVVKRQQETFAPVTMGHIRSHGCRDLLVYCVSGRWHQRAVQTHAPIFLDLLVGIVIGAVGATIYAELSGSGPRGGAAGGGAGSKQ